MHLYDPVSGKQLVLETPQEWGDRLIALFNEMVAAGVPPHEVAYYFVDTATCMRCDHTMKINIAQMRAKKGA